MSNGTQSRKSLVYGWAKETHKARCILREIGGYCLLPDGRIVSEFMQNSKACGEHLLRKAFDKNRASNFLMLY